MQFGEERVHLVYMSVSQSCGNSGEEPGVMNCNRSHVAVPLIGSLFRGFPSYLSYAAQAHLPKDETTLDGLDPSKSINNQDSVPTDMPTDQAGGDNCSVVIPSPEVRLGLCQVDRNEPELTFRCSSTHDLPKLPFSSRPSCPSRPLSLELSQGSCLLVIFIQ